MNNEWGGLPHVVVPTIRDEEQVIKFLNAWKEEFKGCVVHMVFDMPEIPEWVKEHNYDFPIAVYCWKDIDRDLGDKAWIIPRQTDCVRSYGYWKAWQRNPLFIVTLDDDVEPEDEVIKGHYNNLFQRSCCEERWTNTMKHRLPRGTYAGFNNIVISHGCWLKTPDLSAEEQLQGYEETTKNDFNELVVPKGSYYSMCGMNLAWKPEITKYMYFGLQGLGNYPIDRCGDIWAGIYSKYKIDQEHAPGGYTILGKVVWTGPPYVIHTRASNPWSNLKKEELAHDMTYDFVDLIENDWDFDKAHVWEHLDYWSKLKEAYEIWEGLFNEEDISSS